MRPLKTDAQVFDTFQRRGYKYEHVSETYFDINHAEYSHPRNHHAVLNKLNQNMKPFSVMAISTDDIL